MNQLGRSFYVFLAQLTQMSHQELIDGAIKQFWAFLLVQVRPVSWRHRERLWEGVWLYAREILNINVLREVSQHFRNVLRTWP
jgi:hypothetical protein